MPDRRKLSARRLFAKVILASLFAIVVLVGLIYLVNSEAFQSTDDAFIDGHIIMVSSKVAGQVQTVHVDDNQTVDKGDLVVELDPRDVNAAERQKSAALESTQAQAAAAQAGLNEAITHVKTQQATVESDRATAAADAAQNEKAQSDLKRFEELYRTRVVSPQDLDQARAAAKAAQATYDAEEKKVASDEALVAEARAQVDAIGALVKSVNAQIHQSDANLATARLNQSYTEVRAPESGWVTQKAVEPGAYIQTGQSLFALVPKNVWVTANFKEDQISRMRPGQEVEVAVDALHGKKFRAHVDSIQAGSGARFSLLPPQNATGNYVKVVQRIPVKILFDEPVNTNGGIPLGPGESVVPTVKVSDPNFSPVNVGIALAIIAAGVIFIASRGRNGRPSSQHLL
ncbi:MAG TPA: HlyD family secretion protein [Chthoniobacterales bacterium]|nr:HlyD family secretion protein [Chthoniobacterales bacterium]